MTHGGFGTYGKVAGILMLDSLIPRIPGDPGHAQTFSFPVSYEIVHGLPFKDLVDARLDNIGLAIESARRLESEGVSFVVADCGLFSVFQDRIARALSIPFLGSSLSLIPFLCSFLSPSLAVGVLTGHCGMLSDAHLRAAGRSQHQDRHSVPGQRGAGAAAHGRPSVEAFHRSRQHRLRKILCVDLHPATAA